MRTAPLLAAILLAVNTAGLAQQPPPRRTGALAPGGTGLIAGRVTDPVSGRAVPDALVWLLIDGADGAMRPESPRVMTDADGRFVFVNVPAGKYGFQAQKSGYLRGLYGAKSIMDLGRDLDLTDGQLVTDLALPIWKYAAIGGTVTDEAGEPVVGVAVRAFRKIVTFGEVRLTPNFNSTSAMTDDRGVYRLFALIPGEYMVAIPSTLTTLPAELMPDLSRGDALVDEVFTAISEVSVLGNSKNQQVGASVIMIGNRTAVPPAPGDDVTAVYRTTLFPAATKLGEATTFTLRAGDERSGVDISLRPVRAGRVSGRIVGPDGPVGPTSVRLIPAGDAFLSVGPGFEVATGLSDAAGRFTLLGVPEGQYVAWVEKRVPASPGQLLLSGNSLVNVSSSGTEEVVLTLQRAPRITVRVDMRDGRAARSLEVSVEAVGPGGRAQLIPDSTRAATAQLVPGRYIVTPYTGDGVCTAALFEGRDVSDEPLVLAAEDVEVTVVCGESPTRLAGTVRGATLGVRVAYSYLPAAPGAEAKALRRAAAEYERGRRRRAAEIFARYPSVEAQVGAALSAWPEGFQRLQEIGRDNEDSGAAQLALGLGQFWRGEAREAGSSWRLAGLAEPDSLYAVRAGDFLHPALPVPGLPTFVPSLASPAALRRLSPPEQYAFLRRRAEGGDTRDHLLFGAALQRLGRPASAQREFERAAALSPNDPDALTAVAVGHFAKDRPAQAFSRLGPLTRRFPRAATVRFHLGEKYMDLSNARRVVYTCSRSSIKEGGVTTLGQTFTRCEIEALPCHPQRQMEANEK
jgi:tetratricopeptide (TPR) repeat protein/protocatechuate 3,4-dioxygenase beta subunit